MNRALWVTLTAVAFCTAHLSAPASLARQDDATPRASPAAMDSEPGMSGTGAAYMVIRNAGEEDDHLIGGETVMAEIVEIHEIVDEAGMMEMRPLAEGLAIPAGGDVTLEPGGYHVMLIGLTEDLRNGMTFNLTLRFERTGEVTVPVSVRPRAATAGNATPAPPVVAGEITIEGPWSRPAPALGAMTEPVTTSSS